MPVAPDVSTIRLACIASGVKSRRVLSIAPLIAFVIRSARMFPEFSVFDFKYREHH